MLMRMVVLGTIFMLMIFFHLVLVVHVIIMVGIIFVVINHRRHIVMIMVVDMMMIMLMRVMHNGTNIAIGHRLGSGLSGSFGGIVRHFGVRHSLSPCEFCIRAQVTGCVVRGAPP